MRVKLSFDEGLSLFELFNPFDLLAIPLIFRIRSSEPRLQNLLRDSLCCCPQAKRQYIGVVPDARSAGSFCILAEGGADTGDFVGGDRSSRACPAEDNAFVGFVCCHALRDFATGERPVYFGVI